MTDIPDDLAPEVAAVLFATVYDDTIKALMGALEVGFQTGDEDLMWAMKRANEILSPLVPVPTQMTLENSGPYVELSDLIITGLMAHRMYQRTMEGPSE